MTKGWGHTRGWSKKLHFFEDDRSLCSGAAPREGETLATVVASVATKSDPTCSDCIARVQARHKQKQNGQRGHARLAGRIVPTRRPRSENSNSKLYPEHHEDLLPGHL